MTNDFNEMLWKKHPRELTAYMSRRTDKQSGDFVNAQAVLTAKTLVAMERTAFWTMLLAFATFTLALVTAIVLITT